MIIKRDVKLRVGDTFRYYRPKMRKLTLDAFREVSSRMHGLINSWADATSIFDGTTAYHVHDWSVCQHGPDCTEQRRWHRPANVWELPENRPDAWLDAAERLERMAATLTSLANTARKCAANVQREQERQS